MKLSSCIVLRPICCLIFLMLAVLSLGGALIPLWISRVKRIENEVKLIAHNIHQELLFEVEETAALFSPVNASAINLVRVLSSSLNESELQFSNIASKVFLYTTYTILFKQQSNHVCVDLGCSCIVQASATIPYLSQISYIGSNGLLFAYYTKGDQLFGLYSNSTFSSTNYAWYVQPANRDTGKLYGEAILSPPSYDLVNSSWFQGALNTTRGYASTGIGWDNDSQDILLLSTAGMDGRAAISLGFPMKSLLDFINSVDFYNGSLYLATKDGTVLTAKGMIPNTHLILKGNQVSFQLIGFDGLSVGEVGNITCQSRDHEMSRDENLLRIWERKYVISCSPVEFAGLQLMHVLALPHNELSSLIDKNIKLALVLLTVMVGAMVITICAFVYLIVGSARREMYLCGALIKQMEATQQAERKSMNKSLAFASASHDVRASLAGIAGLIEICRNEILKRDPSRSELKTNLVQMEDCTKDLLGILNSILGTSKIDAGKMQLEEEEFDIEQTLEDVVDLFHPVGMKKGLDVILDPYDGSVRKFSLVKGDRAKLKQILCNLLSNAVKFTSEGHVTVRVWARKSSLENEILASNQHNSLSCMLCLFFKIDKAYSESSDVVSTINRDSNCMEFVFEVNDTGKGIPKDKHKSVFENYVQVKETSLGQEGTGLGLGIVQSLVRLMGGDVEIVNKEIGERGTCFRFNVFFSVCETNRFAIVREPDIEASGDSIPTNDSFRDLGHVVRTHSPKREGSQVLLFMQSSTRSNILRDFMVRQGIKVHIVKQHEQLSSALQKIKKKLCLTHHSSSGKSDVNSRNDSGLMSRISSSQSKEVPLSSLDGVDDHNNVLSIEKKSSSWNGLLRCILIVVDTRAGLFPEISRVVAEFKRDLNNMCCCHVIWLDRPSTDGDTSFVCLDEDKLSQTDFVMSKPFHGSRFYQAIGLLPEFGRKGEITHNVGNGSTNTSCLVIGKSSEKSKFYAKSFSKSTNESEEILEGTSIRMPLAEKKILVVDDEHVARKITTTIASQLGAKTYSCGNGKEAWEIVRQSLLHEHLNDSLPFDYILMDCMMPEMDGIEATKRIREEEANFGIHIPIVALTAEQWGKEISMMIQAGADGYLTKPAKKENLLKVLTKLNRKSMQ